MHIENAKKWVAALRSGKYQQGKNALCIEGKFCCLGVAHECLVGEGKITRPNDFDAYNRILKELEITSYDQFVRFNDKYGMTFEQIADEVECLAAEAEWIQNKVRT